MNKMKIVRFADPVASSSNIPNMTNRHSLSSTGVKPSTSASGSKPSRNTKNDKISQPPISNEKNKVEVQSMKVKSSLNKKNSDSKNVCSKHVKHPVKGVKALCFVYNECLFDANHAMFLIDHVNSMNVHAKSASKKIKKRKGWKPTGIVFNSVGYKWEPTGRTFTLVDLISTKQVVTGVYTRRPKVPKFVPNSKPKVAKSMTANRMEPGTSQGFDTSVAPSSSSLIDCRLSKLFCGIWTPAAPSNMIGDCSQLTNFVNKFLGTVKFGNDQVEKIMGYGDYQIGGMSQNSSVYICEKGQMYTINLLGHSVYLDLEVAFRKHTCFVRNLEVVYLLSGSRGTNLYSLSIGDMMASSQVCLLLKATKTKSWLWHRRLSHLNFGAINHLARHGVTTPKKCLSAVRKHYILSTRSKMLLKQSDPMVLEMKVNTKPINYAELNRLSEDFGTRFVPQQELSDEQALHPITDQSASSPVKIEAPRELPKMEAAIQQYHVDKQCFEIQKKHFLIENDRLLNQIISQDIVNIVVNSSVDVNTSVKVNSSVIMNDYVNYVEMCNKCLELKAELIKQHNMVEKDEYNRLSKRFSELEQHCIFLEIAMQLNKEIFQKTNTFVNQTEPSFDQLFELNNLKAELQAKDTTIKKLKAHIKRINETSTSESVKKDFDEIETINIELEHRVTRLIAENEHLKQTYKQLYDSIKPSRVRAKEQTESLVNQVNQKSVEISDLNAQLQEKVFVITALKNDLRKLKGKDIVANVGQMSNVATIAPGMYKLDPVILAPKVKNNREAHEYYLMHTMEQAAILKEVVEQAKSRNPLNNASYSACNIPKVTNQPIFSSTGVNPSTSANGLNPSRNTKNDRIPRTPSRNKKNKVEVQSRKVKSSLNKRSSDSKNVCNEHVKHPVKGAKALCSVCNECLFDVNHAMCLIDNVKSMNVRAKSASKKNKKRKEWKPIGKVFNSVGYIWKPTGRTFTLVGNVCPLTRLTATKKVPLRVPIPLEVVAPKQVVTRVYTRRPKVPKFVPNSKPKDAKSMTANRMEPGTSQGFDTSFSLSSSSLIDCMLSKLFCVKFGNDQIEKIMGYGDYQIGNVTISRVYYVEGLGHNLFSVGQFCDLDLEVAFRKHTCFVCNLEVVDLLSGSRGTNMYSLSIGYMMASSLICLLLKAIKTKSWLWHRCMSHLKFGAINHLARHGLVCGLLELKFEKDHLCSACAMGKIKKQSHKPKSEDAN
ncbi:retrovirus-related pol polyprotein from transposon TNT 1-94 [Tanacetum coccineum]